MFESELHDLENQQRLEIVRMRRQFRRTLRSASPKRIIRKHPAICLGSAALVGMWVAPATGSRAPSKAEPPPKERTGTLGKLWNYVLKQMKGKAAGTQGNGHHAGNGSARKASQEFNPAEFISTALATLLASAKKTRQAVNAPGRVDLRNAGQGSSHTAPEFTIGNAGTMNLDPSQPHATWSPSSTAQAAPRESAPIG